MALSTLSLAVFLILTALNDFAWVTISPIVLGIFAFIAGVLLFLESTGVWTYNVGPRRPVA